MKDSHSVLPYKEIQVSRLHFPCRSAVLSVITTGTSIAVWISSSDLVAVVKCLRSDIPTLFAIPPHHSDCTVFSLQ